MAYYRKSGNKGSLMFRRGNDSLKINLDETNNEFWTLRCFYQHVKEVVNNPYTVLIIDLDHFKRINDDFGHDVGDQVLKQFADKVNYLFKNENIFARIGGEEFAAYLPSYELDEVLNFAQTILETARTITVQNHKSRQASQSAPCICSIVISVHSRLAMATSMVGVARWQRGCRGR